MQQVSRHNQLSTGARNPICSLLLNPALQTIFYENARRARLNCGAYFASLLAYGEELVQSNKSLNEGPLTKYQSAGQNLQKINIRVCCNRWVQFTILARGLGVSNCFLMAYLLAVDTEKRDAAGQNEGVPTRRIWNGDPRFLESLTGRHRTFAFSNTLERSLQFASRFRNPKLEALKARILREWTARLRRPRTP